jgi:DNA-binding transcriptional LysR family regulator
MSNFRTLDLNLLRLFDALLAERNLTRAAAKLAMTQSAASNALRRLRDALGDQLFTRAGYGVEPTPYALAIWPAIHGALEQLRETLAPTAFDPRAAHASFVLAMADSTATLLIPSLLQRTETAAPGVSMRVLPLTTRDPRPLLAEGQVDIAVGFFPAVIASLTLASQEGRSDQFGHSRLYSSAYVCVMRRDHPLARQALTLDAYCAARHLLVSFSGRPFGFVDQALADLGRRRRVVLTVNQFFTAGQVVARSDLLTVLPRHFLASTGMRHALVVRPLPFEMPPVHVEMLWHSRHTQRPGHQWLRENIAAASANAFGRPRGK